MKYAIEVENLHKYFKKEHVLKGVNLKIPEGKITVIIGFSGAGKSVLLKHLLGLMKPSEGSIKILGTDTRDFDSFEWNEIRKNFGMLFQYSALFDSLSVYDNIAFPMREHSHMNETEIEREIKNLVASVGLEKTLAKYPGELSGGMRKRVALARAIALKPKILLYDEPTTGLDPIMTETVDDLIVETQKNNQITSIIISHDIYSAFRIADQICFLHDGTIKLSGVAEDFLNSDDPLIKQFIHNIKRLKDYESRA